MQLLPNGEVHEVHKDTRQSTSHPIRASKTISEEALRQYLEAKQSKLASYSRQILESQYWSTIIAICTIEEYSCSVNPANSFNFWGIVPKKNEPYFTTKDGRRFRKYDSMEDGMVGIETFLQSAFESGKTTIESFRGWYCTSECTNWESVVISTKEKLESLEINPQ